MGEICLTAGEELRFGPLNLFDRSRTSTTCSQHSVRVAERNAPGSFSVRTSTENVRQTGSCLQIRKISPLVARSSSSNIQRLLVVLRCQRFLLRCRRCCRRITLSRVLSSPAPLPLTQSSTLLDLGGSCGARERSRHNCLKSALCLRHRLVLTDDGRTSRKALRPYCR